MTSLARQVCRACLVRAVCLEHAIANRIANGVWGGRSERARRRIVQVREGSVPFVADGWSADIATDDDDHDDDNGDAGLREAARSLLRLARRALRRWRHDCSVSLGACTDR